MSRALQATQAKLDDTVLCEVRTSLCEASKISDFLKSKEELLIR